MQALIAKRSRIILPFPHVHAGSPCITFCFIRAQCGHIDSADSLLHGQLTYSYQLNQPPPLGSPECQFPEITRPGVCANMVAYIPAPANAVRASAWCCT